MDNISLPLNSLANEDLEKKFQNGENGVDLENHENGSYEFNETNESVASSFLPKQEYLSEQIGQSTSFQMQDNEIKKEGNVLKTNCDVASSPIFKQDFNKNSHDEVFDTSKESSKYLLHDDRQRKVPAEKEHNIDNETEIEDPSFESSFHLKQESEQTGQSVSDSSFQMKECGNKKEGNVLKTHCDVASSPIFKQSFNENNHIEIFDTSKECSKYLHQSEMQNKVPTKTEHNIDKEPENEDPVLNQISLHDLLASSKRYGENKNEINDSDTISEISDTSNEESQEDLKSNEGDSQNVLPKKSEICHSSSSDIDNYVKENNSLNLHSAQENLIICSDSNFETQTEELKRNNSTEMTTYNSAYNANKTNTNKDIEKIETDVLNGQATQMLHFTHSKDSFELQAKEFEKENPLVLKTPNYANFGPDDNNAKISKESKTEILNQNNRKDLSTYERGNLNVQTSSSKPQKKYVLDNFLKYNELNRSKKIDSNVNYFQETDQSNAVENYHSSIPKTESNLFSTSHRREDEGKQLNKMNRGIISNKIYPPTMPACNTKVSKTPRKEVENNAEEIFEFEIPSKFIAEKIVSHVEFYFTDFNILKNNFLLKHIRKNKDGYVSLKLISSFRKVKTLTKDWRVVAHCLEDSKWMELNTEKTKVRRTTPIPRIEDTSFGKTIIVFNLPFQNPTREQLEELFVRFGKVVYAEVMTKRSKNYNLYHKRCIYFNENISSNVFGVVEFENHKDAQNAIRDDESYLPKENQMRVVPLVAKHYRYKAKNPRYRSVISYPRNGFGRYCPKSEYGRDIYASQEKSANKANRGCIREVLPKGNFSYNPNYNRSYFQRAEFQYYSKEGKTAFIPHAIAPEERYVSGQVQQPGYWRRNRQLKSNTNLSVENRLAPSFRKVEGDSTKRKLNA